MFINQAKIFICSVAPPFPMLAAARAGFRLIVSEQAEQVGQHRPTPLHYDNRPDAYIQL